MNTKQSSRRDAIRQNFLEHMRLFTLLFFSVLTNSSEVEKAADDIRRFSGQYRSRTIIRDWLMPKNAWNGEEAAFARLQVCYLDYLVWQFETQRGIARAASSIGMKSTDLEVGAESTYVDEIMRERSAYVKNLSGFAGDDLLLVIKGRLELQEIVQDITGCLLGDVRSATESLSHTTLDPEDSRQLRVEIVQQAGEMLRNWALGTLVSRVNLDIAAMHPDKAAPYAAGEA